MYNFEILLLDIFKVYFYTIQNKSFGALPFHWLAITNNNALRTSRQLDYDAGDQRFNVAMEGTVDDYPGLATTTIQVTVVDMDDQDPVFTHTKYEIHIPENVRFLSQP